MCIVRQKGYHATSVEELCAAADVTKGAFFHHFKSKQDLAVAAAEHWSGTTGALFAQTPYHAPADLLDRVIGYLGFRAALIRGTTSEFTCLVGTMAQETFLTNPAIRDACFDSIAGHAEKLEADLAAAIAVYGVTADVTAKALPCTPRRSCKARSSWQRPRTTRRSPPTASGTCGGMWNCCFVSRKQRRKTMTEATDITLPAGMHVLSPHLVCAGAADAIDFYKAAFGATELIRLAAPDGRLMHACLSVNGSSVMLVDENSDYGMLSPKSLNGTPVTIHLIVKDADGVAQCAVDAGGRLKMPVQEMFWGDRYGVLEDPFGHCWSVATPQRQPMTAEELAAAARQAFCSQAGAGS